MKCVRCSTASDNVELEKILECSEEKMSTDNSSPALSIHNAKTIPFQISSNISGVGIRNYDGYECPKCGEFSWIRNKEFDK